MPRQNRIDYPGALHHVIGRGIAQTRIFGNKGDKREFLKRLKNLISECKMKCYAWCIMDNHTHLLLQSGKISLPEFMRRLFTSYALYYNKAHKRCGHVFQNRYKSIVCEKDGYLMLLVRYIHLNPVKAGVLFLRDLDMYAWTSHKELMGYESETIDRLEVLGYFGKHEINAKNNYMEFLKDGLAMNEDYEGGGLKRSGGGIGAVMMRSKEERENYDERILGSSEFVDSIFDSIEHKDQPRKVKDFDELSDRIRSFYGVDNNISLRSRIKLNRKARDMFIYLSSMCFNENLASIGRALGLQRAAVSIAMKRIQQRKVIQEEVEKILF